MGADGADRSVRRLGGAVKIGELIGASGISRLLGAARLQSAPDADNPCTLRHWWQPLNNYYSKTHVAVAKKADRTAYNVCLRYNCRAKLPKMKRLE